MFDTLLSIIAPHHCYKCGKTGGILCLDCKKYITSRKYDMCVLCGDLLENGNLCKKHKLPCDMIWCFSRRTGVVAKIIDDYKFNRVQAAAGLLSEFLDEALPELPPDAVIVQFLQFLRIFGVVDLIIFEKLLLNYLDVEK